MVTCGILPYFPFFKKPGNASSGKHRQHCATEITDISPSSFFSFLTFTGVRIWEISLAPFHTKTTGHEVA
jgi:hypothetical protein